MRRRYHTDEGGVGTGQLVPTEEDENQDSWLVIAAELVSWNRNP